MYFMPFMPPRSTVRRRVATATAAAVLGAGWAAWPVVSATHPAPVHIGVTAAGTCTTALVVAYSTEALDGVTWKARQDDGKAKVQLHYVGDGSGAGQWADVASVSGGENRRRVTLQVPTFDLVRVVRTDTGVTSTGRAPGDCPA